MESGQIGTAGAIPSRHTWSEPRSKSLVQERGSNDRWGRYMPIIRRLYVDEDRPLAEVKEIMEKEHGLSASTKMYKRRFVAWGWRKNIRTAGQAYHILDEAKARSPEQTTIRLANGQVVDRHRLAVHLVRRQDYLRSTRKQCKPPFLEPLSIHSLKPPATFRVSEAALFYTKTYIQGRYEGAITAEELDDSRMGLGKPPGVEWNIFAGTVGQLVEHNRINEALVLMRTAPAEMTSLIRCQPTNIVSLVCMLVAHVSGRRRAKDPVEAKQISKVLKALLHYGSTIAAQNRDQDPSFLALSEVLRSLSAVDDDHLVHACLSIWRLNCQTWDAMVPGCTSLVVDWLNFGDETGMDQVPFDPEVVFRQQLQFFEQKYGEYDHRCIEVLSFLTFYTVGFRAKKGLNPFDNTVLELCEDTLRRKPQKAIRRIITLQFAAEAYFKRGDLDRVETYMRATVDAIREERGDQCAEIIKVASCLEEWMWKAGDSRRAMEAANWRAGLLAVFEQRPEAEGIAE